MRGAGFGLHKGKTALINPKLQLGNLSQGSRFPNDKMRGAGFEPANPLRERILSPPHLTTLLPPRRAFRVEEAVVYKHLREDVFL